MSVEQFREIVERDVIALEHTFLNDGAPAIQERVDKLREKIRSAGLFAPHLQMELMEFARISEVLGRTPLGHYVFNCQAPDVGNMEILISHGTDLQKQQWLEPLKAGAIRSCFSMTEPDRAGSNPTWLDTRAQLDGDDYVINGRKWFTSSADGAAFAIVMAVTHPDAPKHERASMIIVPTDTPGFELVRNISVMGTPGAGYFSHAEVAYENCRVPRSNLLGPAQAGFAIAQERLGPGRIHHCMRWIGVCERAFDLMCSRAKTRSVTPDKKLGELQMVQEWIAMSRVEIHAARLLVIDAATKIDTKGLYEAREEVSMIKFYVAGVLQRVLDRAIQVHGALGMTDDTPLAFWYSHERAARIYDGPDEVHKALVARKCLERAR